MNYTLIFIIAITNLITNPSGEKMTVTENTVISVPGFKTNQACRQELSALERSVALTPNTDTKFKHCLKVR